MKGLAEPLPVNPILFAVPPEREEPWLPTAHYASSLVGCLRRDYYRWVGAPVTNPPSVPQAQKMRAGQNVQKILAAELRAFAGLHGADVLSLQEEVPVILFYPILAHPIRGRVDLLLHLRTAHGEVRWLIECKATALEGAKELVGFYARDGQWVEGSLAGHPNYLAQIWAYALALGDQVDHVALAAFDRNTYASTVYELRVDGDQAWWAALPNFVPEQGPVMGTWRPVPFRWHQVLQRLELLEGYVQRQELPPRWDPLTGEAFFVQFDKTGKPVPPKKDVPKEGENWWLCRYCGYRDLCWERLPQEPLVATNEVADG